MELRNFEASELRADGESRKIVGLAAPFNSFSHDLGGFREQISPGAFTKTLKEKRDIKALFDHDSSKVLGSRKNGTLTLEETTRGLEVEIEPPETAWADDLLVSIRRKDISQMSFGFDGVKDTWTKSDRGIQERTLLEIRLNEVSAVAFPAYEATKLATRSLCDVLGLDALTLDQAIVKDPTCLTEADVAILEAAQEGLRAILSARPAEEPPVDRHSLRDLDLRIKTAQLSILG